MYAWPSPGVISRTWNLYEMAIAIEAGDSVADDSGIDRSYLDTSLPIDRRIEILLAQMTPEEKWNSFAKAGAYRE